jgi:O-antigen/teichoic acid export membrane protein
MKSVVGQLFKNLITSYAGMVLGLLLTFFFTPYFINKLGKEQYGIWTLLFSIITYMEMVDMGMRQSIVRFISKYYAVKDWVGLNKVFSSSIRIYTIVGIVFFVVTLIVVFGFLHSFQIPTEYDHIAQWALIILGLSTALNFVQMPSSSLGPFHRFDISFYINFSTKVLQTLGMVILLEMGKGLIEMAVLVLVLQLLSRLVMSSVRKRLFPEVRFSFAAIDKETTREMFSYAFFSFLVAATWVISNQSDNIIIGRFISVEAVAVYSVAAQLMTQLRTSVYAIATPIVPTISHFEAENKFERIISLYSKSTRYLYYLSGFFAIGMFILGGPFIHLWVKNGFEDAVTILYLLAIPTAISIPQTIATSVLYGISRHKLAVYILGSEAVIKIVLSVILAQSMGIIGVAIGTVVSQLIIYTAIYPVMFYKAINAPVSQFYKEMFRSMFLSALFTLPIGYIVAYLDPPASWAHLFFDAGIMTLFMLVGLWMVILQPDDKASVIRRLPGFLRRKLESANA